MNRWHLRKAARILNTGGVIAYPTEAVFGLGCRPWDAGAVARILTLKRRDPAKGLIVIAAEIEQLAPLIDLNGGISMDELQSTWPGPVTWVIPARPGVPQWLRGNHAGIAVRVTAHPVAGELCRLTGPLISTSANPEGLAPARTGIRVRAYFRDQLDCILPGKVGDHASPTEIRRADSGEVLRSAAKDLIGLS
ncbi:MAG: tRNA threonylcarbamoyladenosine biosynthesis protein RimN [Gammaproteobacteria bacterium]|nr:MAG: tRNA threonylcarbamoyladenosine biosynthesis protein RimN [Gammaproteobacteria bacterium]